MEYEEITHKIIGCAYQVFNHLGFGFLESVYKKAMLIELTKNNFKVEEEKPLKVYYDGQVVGDFYVDLFVEDAVMVELRSVQNLNKEHEVQVVNYLNGLKKDIGLLINFGPSRVQVKRKYRKPRLHPLDRINRMNRIVFSAFPEVSQGRMSAKFILRRWQRMPCYLRLSGL